MIAKDSQPLKVDSPMAVPEFGGGHNSGLSIEIYTIIYMYIYAYVYIFCLLSDLMIPRMLLERWTSF